MIINIDRIVFIKKKIDDCDAIVLRTFNLSAELINSAKKLQIISRHGVGYDNVDTNFLKKNHLNNYGKINYKYIW